MPFGFGLFFSACHGWSALYGGTGWFWSSWSVQPATYIAISDMHVTCFNLCEGDPAPCRGTTHCLLRLQCSHTAILWQSSRVVQQDIVYQHKSKTPHYLKTNKENNERSATNQTFIDIAWRAPRNHVNSRMSAIKRLYTQGLINIS